MSGRKWTAEDIGGAIPFWFSTKAGGCPTPGKRTWEKRAWAKKSLKRWDKARGEKMNVYKCPCGGYHVGHMNHGMDRDEHRQIAQAKAARL